MIKVYSAKGNEQKLFGVISTLMTAKIYTHLFRSERFYRINSSKETKTKRGRLGRGVIYRN